VRIIPVRAGAHYANARVCARVRDKGSELAAGVVAVVVVVAQIVVVVGDDGR